MCPAESSKGLVQLTQCDLAKTDAQERPYQLINDLRGASRCAGSAVTPTNARTWPLIRVSVNLEPDSNCPEETRGVVVLKVV